MAAKYLSSSRTLTALLLLGCLGQASVAQPSPGTASSDATDNYDQVLAHMPREHAVTASVALAQLNISLHNAKKTTERILCNGNWSPSGELLQQVGPLVIEQSAEQTVWLYQSMRRAHPLACNRVSRALFFLEMSRHLPAWVSIRPAGQVTAFSQGFVQLLPPSYLAVR